MLKKMIVLMSVLFVSGFSGVMATPSSAVHAQSVYQSIPKRFRGAWRLKKSNWKTSKKYLHITKRSFRGDSTTLTGKHLGIKKQGKNSIRIFQINKGRQSGENTLVSRVHYKGKVALKIRFDTAIQYYTHY